MITDGPGDFAAPSAAKPRQMLALLALNAPSIVSVGSIVEELWSEWPPPSARTTLQTYVLQLRRLVREGSADPTTCDPKKVLVTRPGGYQLILESGGLDADEFEKLRQRGVVAFSFGRYSEAAEIMGSALALWRGPALVDIEPGPLLLVEITRLEENRMAAQVILMESMLQLGQHAEVTGELLALNLQHPMREDICAQVMVALYRAGRRSEALDGYRRLHKLLAEEMGLEPPYRIRALHDAILREDSSLDLDSMLEVAQLSSRPQRGG
ncbi:MAG TPA: AfsR/SARP family transcriptional regulator [Jatrophihabitans sp.]|jgi:DNA-binding SARP family transcriptional activator|uniref:AfsR/SARP family transcriptional regulator n=1 Tax=Jatrophihabitans sp. TaxID=1932789 RepID=UPI002EDD11C7